MCRLGGIISFRPMTGARLDKAVALSKRLLLNMEYGGHDATGVAAFDMKTGAYQTHKLGVEASDYVKLKECDGALRLEGAQALMLHTRAGTHGTAKDNVNNHPFVGQKLVLAHNGVIGNETTVKQKFGLVTEGECDSEVILRLIEKMGSFRKAMNELSGSAALSVADPASHRYILYRGDGSQLVIAYDKDDDWYVYASTYDILAESYGSVTIDGLDMNMGLPFVELDTGDLFTFDFDAKCIRKKTGYDMKEYKWEAKGKYGQVGKYDDDYEKVWSNYDAVSDKDAANILYGGKMT